MRSLRLLLLTTLLLSACGPGQVFGPTLTPTPSATATPTATLDPMPLELERLPEGVAAVRLDDGWGLSVEQDGKTTLVDGILYKDNALEVTLADGTKVEAGVSQLATWEILGEKYLVLNSADSIPQYRFVEGQGWVSAGRPDFEHMTDDELLDAAEKWGEFFANQVDCSPGVAGLPAATEAPKLVEVNSYRDVFTWETQYLGYYQVLLSDERNLPVGHVNCLYFAASEPGGVFTVWGGGKIWGDTLTLHADNESFRLPNMNQSWDDMVDPERVLSLMVPDNKYFLDMPVVPDLWNSVGIDIHKQFIRSLSLYEKGHINGGLLYLIRRRLEERLSNYPASNAGRLVDNHHVPVSGRIVNPE